MMPDSPPIDGATPISDISGLRLLITTREEVIRAEALNIARPTAKYLASRQSARGTKFDREWLISLHGEMYCDVWDWAGTLRQTQYNIGVATHAIREQLQILIDDLKQWQESNMPIIEQAARLHHRAVWIHPFPDGNGRWARLLTDIWLKRNGSAPIKWPSQVGDESPIRNEYIDAVRKADDGNFEPLIELHHRFRSDC